jgi:hypothetical protein
MKKLITIGIICLFFIPISCAPLKKRDWKPPVPALYAFDKQRMLLELQKIGVIYPEWFVKVAVIETGHNFEHASDFDYWGFKRPGSPYSEYIQDNGYGFAKFQSRLQAYWFLKEWVKMAPPRPNEHPVSWLKRRGYNPEDPLYYDILKQIEI